MDNDNTNSNNNKQGEFCWFIKLMLLIYKKKRHNNNTSKLQLTSYNVYNRSSKYIFQSKAKQSKKNE